VRDVSAIAWSTIESALWAWVVAASGLAASNVIWEERAPLPVGSYISLRLTVAKEVGQDWLKNERVISPPPGAEILQKVVGARVASLELSCFANGDKTIRTHAVLTDVLAARALPSHRAALGAARIGFGPVGSVQVMSFPNGQLFDPRAHVELALNLVSLVSETTTYIERVDPLEGTVKDVDGTTTLATIDQSAPP
jgi:hypothetical protein